MVFAAPVACASGFSQGSGWVRPTRFPATGTENSRPATIKRFDAPVPLKTEGSRPIRQISGPLGDITNVTATEASKVQTSRPQKRSSTSEESSPTKLRAVGASPSDTEESEYVQDIHALLLQQQVSALPSLAFMEAQTDINARMRAILVDWLVELHRGFRLSRESLFLAVNMLDRFMSRARIPRSKLQLAGVVSLFVAAKFEDTRPPSLRRLAFMTDGAFSVDDILNYECFFLGTIGFKVLVPTAAYFLDHMVRVTGCDPRLGEMGFYLLELGLLETRTSLHWPSAIAAAAMSVAAEVTGLPMPWSSAGMANAAARSLESLKAPAAELRALLIAAPGAQLRAVRKKYSSEEHLAVSVNMVRSDRV